MFFSKTKIYLITLLIFVLVLPSCSNKGEDRTSETQESSYYYNPSISEAYWGWKGNPSSDTLRTSGIREYIESANFHIIRGKYRSGAKFIEVYQNNLTKLDHWKEFYENGQLKEEGVMTNGSHVPVGEWKFYSSTGKMDSLVNYDKKYKISYFKALEIAKSMGYKMPGLDIQLSDRGGTIYWEILKWVDIDSKGGQSTYPLYINTETGVAGISENVSVRVFLNGKY